MGQRAGQGDTARNDGTGSGMEIYSQEVRGRKEDRENKRKWTGSGAEMEKETLETERGGECRDRGREREQGEEKILMGSRPEGQGKTGGRTEGYRKQVRDREPESWILRKREGRGAGHRDRETMRATERMTERWSTRKNRDRERDRQMKQ